MNTNNNTQNTNNSNKIVPFDPKKSPPTYFEKLNTIMKNEDFRDFISEVEDLQDMKVAFMFMKMYLWIETEYKKIYGKDISDDEITGVMKKMIANGEIRSSLVSNTFGDSKLYLTDI